MDEHREEVTLSPQFSFTGLVQEAPSALDLPGMLEPDPSRLDLGPLTRRAQALLPSCLTPSQGSLCPFAFASCSWLPGTAPPDHLPEGQQQAPTPGEVKVLPMQGALQLGCAPFLALPCPEATTSKPGNSKSRLRVLGGEMEPWGV